VVVSSLLVISDSDAPETLETDINSIEGVEVTEIRDSKFAVVVETRNTQDAVEITARLKQLPGVVSLQLVSHFFEDEADNH